MRRLRLRELRELARSRATLVILCSQLIVLYVGQGLVVPILPLYARTFGVDATMVGLLLAMQAVPRAFVNVPAGKMADRYGAHRIIVAAAIVVTLASFGGAIAASYWFLVATRVLQGIGSAMSHTAGLTYTANVSSVQRRGRSIALFQGSFLIGIGIGPAVGGIVAELLGYRAPFLLYTVLGAATAFWVHRKLPDPRPERERANGKEDTSAVASAETTPSGPPSTTNRRSNQRRPRLLLHRAVLLASLFGFVAAYTRTGTRDFGVVLVAADIEAGEAMIGGVMSMIVLANLAVLYLAGTLIDRYGVKAVILTSWLFTAVSLMILSGAASVGPLALAAIVYGLASGVGNPVPAVYISNEVEPSRVGSALGMYRSANDVGMVVGPLAMGAMTTTIGVRVGLQVNAALVLGVALVFALFHRSRAPRRAAVDDLDRRDGDEAANEDGPTGSAKG